MVYLMTEKWMPHHDLEAIKATFAASGGLVTSRALQDAASLGCDRSKIDAVIKTIVRGHFYKSMTSNYDHKIWQDVYHVPFQKEDAQESREDEDSADEEDKAEEIELYVKFTDNGGPDFVLLSFKEK
jgi:motility quorum-sensing regulator/GCU-specific mRNA interferase toxin